MDRLNKALAWLLLGAALCFGSSAIAQSSKDVCSVEFQVMVFSARKQISSGSLKDAQPSSELPDLYFRGAEGYELVKISHTTLSNASAYVGPTNFVLYTRKMTEDGAVYSPAFSLNFGVDWKRAIVVLMTDSVGEQRSRAIAINTSEQNIPAGTILIYNLSLKELVLNAGKDIYNLPPLVPATVPVGNIKDNTLPVQLALKDNEEYKLVYRRKWRMQPGVSGVYFLFTLDDNDRRWFMKNIIL